MDATLQSALSAVGWSVDHTLVFFMILLLWPPGSCPNGLVTSNMVPDHPHATVVAVYPALFSFHNAPLKLFHLIFYCMKVSLSMSWLKLTGFFGGYTSFAGLNHASSSGVRISFFALSWRERLCFLFFVLLWFDNFDFIFRKTPSSEKSGLNQSD